MSGSSFFTKPFSPGYDPIRNAVFGIGDSKSSTPADAIDALPVPTPGSPITPANQQVVQAEQDYAKANLLKKSINRTIFAGDTGGYSSTAPNLANTAAATGSFKKLGG